jgi:hypothetical protein
MKTKEGSERRRRALIEQNTQSGDLRPTKALGRMFEYGTHLFICYARKPF